MLHPSRPSPHPTASHCFAKSWLLLGVLTTVATSAALGAANEPTPTPTSAPAATSTAVTLQTTTRVQTTATLHPHGHRSAAWQLQQGFTWQPSEPNSTADGDWQAHLSLDAQADTDGQAQGTQAWSTQRQQRPALAVGNAYLQQTWHHGAGTWRVRLGRQTLDWATTDTVSPLDPINPRDWSDLSRVRKRPLPALSLRWDGTTPYGAPATAEWVATPGGQGLLPQGTWQQPLPPGVVLAPTARPGHQLGMRLTTQQGDNDLSLVLYRGPALSPSVRVDVPATASAGTGAASVSLHPAHDTVHLWGLGLTRPVAEGSMLRLEWARQRQSAGDDFDTLVASVDHELNGLLHPRDTVYLLLQGQWEKVHERGQPQPDGWWDFRRVFRHHAMARLQYQPADTRWLWTVETTLHPASRQHYLRVAAQYRLNPQWQVTWGVVSAHGPKGSFWGSHQGGRQAFAELVWTR